MALDQQIFPNCCSVSPILINCRLTGTTTARIDIKCPGSGPVSVSKFITLLTKQNY